MAKNSKYEELANSVVDLVGGKENIVFFTHCVTRLRFTIKDKGEVQDVKINQLKNVIGSNWSGEQFQIILGQDVANAYKLICDMHNFDTESNRDSIDNKGNKSVKAVLNSILENIAGCVSPCVTALIGGGMIKVVLLLLMQLNIITPESGTYVTLTFVSDAPFYFLPVIVGATAAKKFGANMIIGMSLGAVLIHPTFVAMVTEGSGGSIFGVPISAQSYSSNVFAMILTMWIAAKVERMIVKYSPAMIRSVTEPLLTILIMTPIMLCLLAPLGAMTGDFLATGLKWLYDTIGFLGLATLTAVVPVFVLTGMHMAFPAIAMQNFATLGFDPLICIASIIPNFNQGAACAAVALKNKDEAVRSNATSACLTSIVAGVSEPALFGITLKYKTPLIAVMIGSFIGGAIAGIFQCCCYAFPGSFALFSFIAAIGDKGMSNLIYLIIAVVVGMVTTFVLTFIMYKPEEGYGVE